MKTAEEMKKSLKEWIESGQSIIIYSGLSKQNLSTIIWVRQTTFSDLNREFNLGLTIKSSEQIKSELSALESKRN